MFTALILAAILVMAGIALVTKAIKSAVTAIKRQDSGRKASESNNEKETFKPEKQEREKKSESARESVDVSEEVPLQEELPEIHRESLDRMARRGIVEMYWDEPSAIEFDEKAVADLSVARSALSYLEFNNRHLAGEDFHGFNIDVRDGEQMALTYRGQVLATLTRIADKVMETVDGKEVEKESVRYRTSTFPPMLGKDLCVSEIAELIDVTRYVNACSGDPCRVADAMLNTFVREGNISKLKVNIDDRIRKVESLKLRDAQEKSRNQKQPKELKMK